MHERNSPGPEDSEHDHQPDKMGGMKKKPPLPGLPEHRDHHSVEKEKMHRTLGQEAKSKKNEWHGPGEPGRPPFAPPAHPEDEGERAERDIKRLDLDEATFLQNGHIR